jgi:hypothetical protein
MRLRVALVTILTVVSTALRADVKPLEKKIPHLSSASGTLPGINVRHGQELTFVITDTSPNCYTYNLKEKSDDRRELAGESGQVSLSTTHDGEVTAYEIAIADRSDAPQGCISAPRTFTIPVRPYWHLAFTGGFVHDELKDPVFFLEPGKKTEGTTTLDGSYVRQDTEAENGYNIGGASMIHLYSNTGLPVAWVPITFGVALNDSEPRFLLGTTVRFGSLLYLTAGATFGERDRLPTGVHVGDFTQNPNLITTLGKRRDQQAFVAISFKFLDRGLDPFKNALTGRPILEDSKPPTPPPPANTKPSISTTDKKARKVGESLEIEGLNFGDPKDTSIAKFVMFGKTKVMSTDADQVTEWTSKKITVKVPDLLKDEPATTPSIDIDVFVQVGEQVSEKKKLKVNR